MKQHCRSLIPSSNVRLIYLSEANLRDRLFIKDFVHNFALKEKAILFHEPFGPKVADSRFVTKRISALLSETGVYNNAFSADQRNLFQPTAEGVKFHTAEAVRLLPHIQLLIIGPVGNSEIGPQLLDPMMMIRQARKELEISDVLVFTDNPLSPLAGKRVLIESEADVAQWSAVYEEESPALKRAFSLSPAYLCSPTNYSA